MERFNDLPQLQKTAWNLLFRAAGSRNAPMRTPVMATTDGQRPHQRTIVLRAVDVPAAQLFFFSDLRAPKIEHLLSNPAVNVLFWDPRKKVQIEMAGTANIYQQDKPSAHYWKQLNITGRSSYASLLPPGSPRAAEQQHLPDFWQQDMDLAQTDFAYANFALIGMQVQHIDVLHLHPTGHQRARFNWQSANDSWSANWAVP